MVVGEWGAYSGSPGALPAAQFVVRQFEKLLCGETYWALDKNTARSAVFGGLVRPYPAAVAGTILEYQTDFQNRTFSCAWKEDPRVAAPTRIYVPERFSLKKETVTLNPPGQGFKTEPAREGSRNHYLVIPPTGRPVARRLSIAGSP
jgi:hypothetical protein